MSAARLSVTGALLSAASVLATAADRVSDQAAMGHDHAAMSRGSQPTLGTSTYTAADLTFLTHMIVHHRQALALCELVPARSKRDEFQRFARFVNDAQKNEIDMMQRLLDDAARRGATIPPQQLDSDPPMAGMLTQAQMAAISRAQGNAFERLWLEGMRQHHQSGVDMAMAQQAAQYASGNQPYGLDTLVDEMLTVQRAEITQMRKWQETWR